MTRFYQSRASYSTPEPMPKPNDNPSIHDLVIKDIEDRKQFGLEKYGTVLQAGNGRKTAVDLHQELLDAVCYSRSLIEEQNAIIKALLGVMPLLYEQIDNDGSLPGVGAVFSGQGSELRRRLLGLLESLGYAGFCNHGEVIESWYFTQKAIDLMES